jgi:DNA repair protein RadC
MKQNNLVRSKDGQYRARGVVNPDNIVDTAASILLDRLVEGEPIKSAKDSAKFLQHALSNNNNESFGAVFLSSQNQVLAFEILFQGTIDQASVHPRVLVQKTIAHNAAAIILAHNHPSDSVNPSSADKRLTKQLQETLSLIDVRVIDHIIVTRKDTFSFAEHGLI